MFYFSSFQSRRSLTLCLCIIVQLALVSACKSAQMPPWLQEAVGATTSADGPEAGTTPAASEQQPVARDELSNDSRPNEIIPSIPAETQTAEVLIDPSVIPTGPSVGTGMAPVLTPPAGINRTTLPPPTPVLNPNNVRVALLLPMSGPNAALGEAMLNAAQLALFDFADDKFELVLHDTAGDPFFATDAVQKAISDNASMILGPLLGRSVRAISPITRAEGIPMIAFSSDRTVAGDGVYTMGFLPGAEVERVTEYAIGRGLRRFAVMAPDSDYGRAVVESFAVSLEIAGGTLVRSLYYDPFAEDFAPVVQDIADYDFRRRALLGERAKLKGRNDALAKQALAKLKNLQTIGDLSYEALLVADGGERLLNIASLLPFYDVDPSKIQMLGTGQWDVKGLGAEPALQGGWYAAPDPTLRAEFEKQYSEAYGVKPPRLATLAYDATALAAVLAKNQSGANFSTEAITQAAGFSGRDGIFRFKSYGLAERGLAVLSVGQRNSRILDKAPKTFDPQ